MIMQIVRFQSALSREEVMRRFEERSAQYRQVPGLIQKYYVRFEETGEYGGVYLWDSPASLEAWRTTGLSESIAQAYRIEGELSRERAEVMLVLRGD